MESRNRDSYGRNAGEACRKCFFPVPLNKKQGRLYETIFLFDIDGTLTTPLTADYPDSAREAVRRLQEKGNFVAIASGRLQADAVDVAEELGIDSVISDGGNGVTCCGKILYHEGLPLEACFRLLGEIDGKNIPGR